jgi:hypothetical protein
VLKDEHGKEAPRAVVSGPRPRVQLASLLPALYSCGMLDFAAQYAAFQRRDPALDGVVFVAVKTTGIYCRPVCRARTPLARNIHFYPSAQQQRNVLATAPASVAALKQLRSVQRGKAPRQLSSAP